MSDFTLRKGGYKTKPHEIELAQEFLRNFQDKDGVQKYKIQLEEIANLERHALEISLDDVKAFSSDPNFANDIMINTKRYTPLFSAAAFLELPDPNASSHDRGTVYDIWVSIRRNQRDPNQPIDDTFREMITKFEVHFIPFQSHKPFPLRSLRSDSVGSLISIRGVVTRVTDVLPLISVQAYHCKTCGHESYQQVSGREYTPLSECQSLPCRNNHTKGDLSRLDRGSKFRSYQEVKIQELPVEVPVGHIPRSLTVKLYGDSLVRRVKPGDITMISGIYLPTPTSNSFQRGGRGGSGLVTDTYIEASQIRIAKKNYNSIILQEHHIQELHQMSTTPNILERLAKSISPEIFGHVEIKKALLLSMVGGVTKVMLDGMKIRGDINMLLVGDPGMAKSQLLKHVCKIAPRAVYTTGKGSSGVGLTASVQRDPISGDTTLEGGALVLADNGICCIDEFDKMDENDRTSIHEVMEQQTVSIAKAGITTTLNARTTVLAAANPAYGRYNLQRSPSDNLSMPASLLSRFDLLFIMLDRPDAVLDEQLAHHVTFVHQHNAAPVGNANGGDDTNMVFSSDMLRAYISVARQYNPIVSEEASTIITQHYVETRQSTSEEDTKYRTEARDMREEINDRGRFCTARMLLSTIRISQAIARVHFSSVVTEEHARMAVDLMYATQIQLEEMSQKDMEKQNSRKRDPISTIYSVVMRLRENGDSDELSYNMIKDHVLRMGYDEAVLEKTIETYASAGVWSLTRNKKTLRFTMEAR